MLRFRAAAGGFGTRDSARGALRRRQNRASDHPEDLVAVAIWKTAIVVGASSGIGEAIARRLALQGCRVALVARREDELSRATLAIERATSEGRAVFRVHDVRETATVVPAWESIERELGPVDLLVFAAGVLPTVGATEYSFEKDRTVVEVNLLGAMAWLDAAALRMEAARRGAIVAVSSVAGDRGRRGHPAYAASKAALNTFMESLRNRLGSHGVTVCTVRPGFVETPMTRGLALPKRLTVSADRAAELILAAARKRRGVDVHVPARWAAIMFVIRNIPSFVFRRLSI
jgi:decaprenylphospho-beta-D-erythro-pentofuranosid-2-ulose 2-reductase